MNKTIKRNFLLFLMIVATFILLFFKYKNIEKPQSDYFKQLKVNFIEGDRTTVFDLNTDNHFFSVGYEKGIIEFYNIKNNKKKTVKAHELRVSHISSSKNENIVASSSYFEKETKLWNPATGDQIASLPETYGPEKFYLNSNNLVLAAGKKLKIFDTYNKKFYKEEYQCSQNIHSLAISRKGGYIAAGTTNGVCLWNVDILKDNSSYLDKIRNRYKILLSSAGEEIISDSKNWVQSLAFTDDDKKLFAILRNGKLHSWQLGFLDSHKITSTKLRWVRDSIITDNLKIIIGTEDKRGRGIGRIEYLSDDELSSKIIPQKIRTFAPIILINNNQYLLVGASKEFWLIPVIDYF
ncbi:MAG: hypothetical protein CSA35_06700 [Dethiosulfovibrio peptidovorans]|nr:MAG: hypothetical protein CSA35_06700 [Dethiosulfovibrio peptidovorans]